MSELPTGAFDAALERHVDLQRKRIRACYNRTRALFAESLIAELLAPLGTAMVSTDPGAAWDITWEPKGRRVRIEVKCSGGFLPRYKDRPEGPASWDLPGPKDGWAPPEGGMLGKGVHFDVLILARHEGDDIAAAWHFYVLRAGDVGSARTISGKQLAKDGTAVRCEPSELAESVLRASSA